MTRELAAGPVHCARASVHTRKRRARAWFWAVQDFPSPGQSTAWILSSRQKQQPGIGPFAPRPLISESPLPPKDAPQLPFGEPKSPERKKRANAGMGTRCPPGPSCLEPSRERVPPTCSRACTLELCTFFGQGSRPKPHPWAQVHFQRIGTKCRERPRVVSPKLPKHLDQSLEAHLHDVKLQGHENISKSLTQKSFLVLLLFWRSKKTRSLHHSAANNITQRKTTRLLLKDTVGGIPFLCVQNACRNQNQNSRRKSLRKRV